MSASSLSTFMGVPAVRLWEFDCRNPLQAPCQRLLEGAGFLPGVALAFACARVPRGAFFIQCGWRCVVHVATLFFCALAVCTCSPVIQGQAGAGHARGG